MYILTNKYHSVFYIGVTSNLPARMQQHFGKLYRNSFSARYNLNKLVYYCWYHSIQDAIEVEKRIKAGSRKSKLLLIQSINPLWNDLWLTEVSKW
ncbi:MAG: GIY-YIG nuclease family protein [Flavisolibacter sp.]